MRSQRGQVDLVIGSRYVADFVYNVIDQRVVDGAVNGVGFSAEATR